MVLGISYYCHCYCHYLEILTRYQVPCHALRRDRIIKYTHQPLEVSIIRVCNLQMRILRLREVR